MPYYEFPNTQTYAYQPGVDTQLYIRPSSLSTLEMVTLTEHSLLMQIGGDGYGDVEFT